MWVPSNDLEVTEETWNRVTRMSLIGCNIELPESPICSNICTLLLQSLKPQLNGLVDRFFHHMKILQILNLSCTEIRTLPRSIRSLESLKSLYLNDCNQLVALPTEAAELKKLEFLDISETLINSLPQEIKNMLDLRCLRASFCTNLSGNEVKGLELVIPFDIIRHLRKLEELSINTSFINQGGEDTAKTLAKELATLEHLNTLCFNFPTVSSVDIFVDQSQSLANTATSWEKHTFRSYKITIGCQETNQHPYELLFSGSLVERRLKYSTPEKFSPACEKLLEQASAFELLHHDGVESLSQFNLHSLKACVVGSCKKLKYFMDGNIAIEEQSFAQRLPQNLEKLYLYDLELLERICSGVVPSQAFTNVTTITISGCPKLTNILDHALAQALQSLKYLKVEKCSETSEIVEVLKGSSNSEQGNHPSILERLKTVELLDLPKLQIICTSNSISWKNLNSIIVKGCSSLRNLCLTGKNAKKLAVIQLDRDLWESLQLPIELAQHLLPFCHFMSCH